MPRSIITLTTDFGDSSPYVAQMKGVILSINADATIVDITHGVPPQDIRQGAIVLSDVVESFPAGTIHVAVIDPGVGTQRSIVYLRMGDWQFVAPNNGLQSLVAKRYPPTTMIEITNSKFWQEEISSTFHGRDIMAPVAAHLSLGLDPLQLGAEIKQLERLTMPEIQNCSNMITGTIVSFDHFGNLITDIPADLLKDALRKGSLEIRCGSHLVRKLVHTYGEAAPPNLVALVGSSRMLELSVVGGNAAQRLGIQVGETVSVSW